MRAKWPRTLVPNWSSKPSLRLEALGRGHDAGVVDEEVERLAAGELALGKGADGVEDGEVERAEFDVGSGCGLPDAVDGGLAFGGVA